MPKAVLGVNFNDELLRLSPDRHGGPTIACRLGLGATRDEGDLVWLRPHPLDPKHGRSEQRPGRRADDNMKPLRIIAVANHKGGTAKTTTTVNLAACLAERNQQTLLIDLDPQGNASSWLGINSDAGMYSVLARGQSLEGQIQRSAVDGLAVIPASPLLATAERIMAGEPAAEMLLGRKMSQGNLAAWQNVLIDTPPALGLLTINALAAADEVLVPVEAHILALSGVVQVLNTIRLVQEQLNPKLKLIGFVICRFDARTRHCAEVRERLIDKFPHLVLSATIRENVRLAEAPSFGAPIAVYAPASSGAADYRALASEIIAMH